MGETPRGPLRTRAEITDQDAEPAARVHREQRAARTRPAPGVEDPDWSLGVGQGKARQEQGHQEQSHGSVAGVGRRGSAQTSTMIENVVSWGTLL